MLWYVVQQLKHEYINHSRYCSHVYIVAVANVYIYILSTVGLNILLVCILMYSSVFGDVDDYMMFWFFSLLRNLPFFGILRFIMVFHLWILLYLYRLCIGEFFCILREFFNWVLVGVYLFSFNGLHFFIVLFIFVFFFKYSGTYLALG